MKKSLKQKNRPQLIIFLVTNVLAVGAALFGLNAVSTLFAEVLGGNLPSIGKIIILPAVVTVVLGIISWILPTAAKEAIVFWRVGPKRLPSSKAFTVIAPADPRIDMARLTARLGTPPHEPTKQNALWYVTYRKHDKELSVTDANGAYLLYREMTVLVLFIAFSAFGLAIAVPNARENLEVVGAILMLEYVVLMLATRNAGTRLVSNLLAVEAATADKREATRTTKPRSLKASKVRSKAPADSP